ncbi:MAG: DUF503 domain-containing protein [Chloroflexi bacterium]|nr:DUF503 domain-containing protein [Chloroflexota bacterium]
MVIGVARVVLRLAENESLKGKRQVVKSLLARLRNTFGVAAAEVDTLDSWHTATLGIALVSNDAKHVDEVLGKVLSYVEETRLDAEVVSFDTEILHSF